MLPSVLSDALIAETMQSINVLPAVQEWIIHILFFHPPHLQIWPFNITTQIQMQSKPWDQNPKQIHTDRYIVQLDIWGSKINRHFTSKLKITWRGWWSHGPGGGREMVRLQPLTETEMVTAGGGSELFIDDALQIIVSVDLCIINSP